jgi:uncharacterized protein YdaU (DUF1376 family)
VNYFELYPGDYLRDTTRLSLVEHGAYLRLLMAYYSEEEPLPNDFDELFTIAGAVKTADKMAVKKVADKFFPLRPDGLRHNARADEEIAKAGTRMDAKDDRKSSEAQRQQRYRDRRRDMFEALARVGVVPKFNISMDELTDLVTQNVTSQTVTNVTPSRPLHTATRPHTPDPIQELPTDNAGAQPEITPATQACLLMKQAGCGGRVNPSHPDLLAAIAEGVTPETLANTAAEAIASSKGEPFTWAIKTARNRHAAGAATVTGETRGTHAPSHRESTAERAARFAREGDEADARRAAADDPNHGHAPAMGEDGGDLRPPLDVGVRRALRQ